MIPQSMTHPTEVNLKISPVTSLAMSNLINIGSNFTISTKRETKSFLKYVHQMDKTESEDE